MRHKRSSIAITPFVARIRFPFIVGVFICGFLLGFILGSIARTSEEPIERVVYIDRVEAIIKPIESYPIQNEVEEELVTYYDCPLDNDLQDYIREQCETKRVPMSLVVAMIEVESSFQADVVSGTSDYGLMQINEINHEWLSEEYGITDFLDPYQNVFCGITILSEHYDRFQDVDKALMAYNLGATGAKKLWDKGIYETSYTRKINTAKEAYENEI